MWWEMYIGSLTAKPIPGQWEDKKLSFLVPLCVCVVCVYVHTCLCEYTYCNACVKVRGQGVLFLTRQGLLLAPVYARLVSAILLSLYPIPL